MISLEELNQFELAEFVAKVGWVFEHSPWVAEWTWQQRPFASLDDLHARLTATMLAASREEQVALLRAHPDLGTRAQMSMSSTQEQSGAGLDQLNAAEFERLHRLNETYKRKFGFPFLYAVKGSGKEQILDALERRLRMEQDLELAEALNQVARIARFRLEEVVEE